MTQLFAHNRSMLATFQWCSHTKRALPLRRLVRLAQASIDAYTCALDAYAVGKREHVASSRRINTARGAESGTPSRATRRQRSEAHRVSSVGE